MHRPKFDYFFLFKKSSKDLKIPKSFSSVVNCFFLIYSNYFKVLNLPLLISTVMADENELKRTKTNFKSNNSHKTIVEVWTESQTNGSMLAFIARNLKSNS